MIKILALAFVTGFMSMAQAADKIKVDKIKIVTTTPDLAEAARKIGGDKVEVESLLKGSEDAHFLDAVPTYIRMVATADVVCVMGLDLEIGWMPKIFSKSGNAKVQPGGVGYCETGKAVNVIEKPNTPVDRSMGDVHALGNPHFNLSPKAMAEAAGEIEKTLSQVKPEWKDLFVQGLKGFQKEMAALEQNIRKKLKNQEQVIEYHKEFTYFFNLYGVKSFGSIEEKPGIPPSGSRLAEVAKGAKVAKVCLALAALYAPDNQLKKFSELSGIGFKKFPAMVLKNDEKYNSIEKLQNAIAEAIVTCGQK